MGTALVLVKVVSWRIFCSGIFFVESFKYDKSLAKDRDSEITEKYQESGKGRQSEREWAVPLSECRPIYAVGEVWALNYLHCLKSPSLLCLGRQGAGRVSMRVTVNETFRAGFRTGFLLTRRPSLHTARSLQWSSPFFCARGSWRYIFRDLIVESPSDAGISLIHLLGTSAAIAAQRTTVAQASTLTSVTL